MYHSTAERYWIQANTDPAGGSTGYPQLAVNNDADGFSLCSGPGAPIPEQRTVVFRASTVNANASADCYPVVLQIIPNVPFIDTSEQAE